MNARFTAKTAASLQSEARSAPTNPAVRRANDRRSTAPSSRIRRDKTRRICSRLVSDGIPIQISLSDRDNAIRMSWGQRRTTWRSPIETACSAQSWIERIGAIGGADHDDRRSRRRQRFHADQQLANDSPFHLSASILSLWRDAVNLVDEDLFPMETSIETDRHPSLLTRHGARF